MKGESLANDVIKFSFIPTFIDFVQKDTGNNNYPPSAKDNTMKEDEFKQILLKFLKDEAGKGF